jgi:hypothetical protein
MWASRLRAAVELAEARPIVSGNLAELDAALKSGDVEGDLAPVIVDLTGRTYDGVQAVQAATSSGRRVLAVGQHEDLELRRRALDAGASRVFSYNKLFSDGPDIVSALLEEKL